MAISTWAWATKGPEYDVLNNAQRIDLNFFSGILRLDVDKKPGSLAPHPHAAVPTDDGVARYAVPPNNPYVGITSFDGAPVNPANVRTEFWAVGLRNPWRFSFDPQTGDLWVGDVGQDAYEEIDLATHGGNFGWSYREASHPGPKAASTPVSFTSIDPYYEYAHGTGDYQGNSIIGGVFFHGFGFDAIKDCYVFCDEVDGNIWALRPTLSGPAVQLLAKTPGIVSFGLNPTTGEVLLANIATGKIQKLARILDVPNFPATLSATGLFADPSDLSPNPGVLSYSINLPAWANNAKTSYWFTFPDTISQMTSAPDAPWTYPAGMAWVQNFDMDMTQGDPTTRQHIETRVLVKTDTGVYGVSYQWNDAQTEATLVGATGANLTLNTTVNGTLQPQIWHVPSRSECLDCHNPTAGFALSFNSRQLNRTAEMNGFVGNLLELLYQYGYIANNPGPTKLLPRYVAPAETTYALETRARSYVAVNCVACHQAGISGTGTWDGRIQLTLAQTGLVKGTVVNNTNGNPANRYLVPGDVVHSVLYDHLAVANGFTPMPPTFGDVVDSTGASLIQSWIQQSLPRWRDYASWRQLYFLSPSSDDGAQTADPDGDGADNYSEFLAGSSPLDPTDKPSLHLAIDSLNNIAVQFSLPGYRSFEIQTSSDLIQWSPWNVPGNNGLPSADGINVITFPAPPPSDLQFFRLLLREN